MMIVLGNTVRIVNVLLSIAYMLIIVWRLQDRRLDRGLSVYLRGVGSIMASAVIGGWLQFNQPFRASQPFYTAGVLTLIYASLKRQADTGRSGNDA